MISHSALQCIKSSVPFYPWHFHRSKPLSSHQALSGLACQGEHREQPRLQEGCGTVPCILGGQRSPSSETPLGRLGVGASFSSSTSLECLELVAIGDKMLELMEERSDPGWQFLCGFFRPPQPRVWPASCIWQGYRGEVRTKFKPSCHMHQCLINYTVE